MSKKKNAMPASLSPAPLTIQACLEDCMAAMDLFLNNHFTEGLDKLRPRAADSMYHALFHSSLLAIHGMMTFQQDDIISAGHSMKTAQELCQRRRRRSTTGSSISAFGGQKHTEEELHAEVCYAECLLHRAALTFLQEESMTGLVKGGIKIRHCYNVYKQLHSLLQSPNTLKGPNHSELRRGVALGIGAFNVTLSMFPARILKLLKFIGFSGDKEYGLSQLHEGAVGSGLRSVLCVVLLLCYHTLLAFLLGIGEENLSDVEELFRPLQVKYPRSAIILFFAARVEQVKGNIDEAIALFDESCKVQQAWRQLHHVCYWELMWSCTLKRVWRRAHFYTDLLYQEGHWSQAMSLYMKAAYISMLASEEARPVGKDEVELFRQVASLKDRMAGKSSAVERLAVRKALRYRAQAPVRLPVPALEMMYLWNGFAMIRNRPDLTEGMLETVLVAERHLLESPENYFAVDDECVIQFLKGVCLKNLGQTEAAEACFAQVCSRESKVQFDGYLVPNALLEMSLLYRQRGDTGQALSLLQRAKSYKDYSMESRTTFRIRSALSKLGSSPTQTSAQM